MLLWGIWRFWGGFYLSMIDKFLVFDKCYLMEPTHYTHKEEIPSVKLEKSPLGGGECQSLSGPHIPEGWQVYSDHPLTFSEFLRTLEVSPHLFRIQANTPQKEVAWKRLLSLWIEAGRPDLGEWPEFLCRRQDHESPATTVRHAIEAIFQAFGVHQEQMRKKLS